MGEFVILMQFSMDEIDKKKKKIYAVNCLPDLPSTGSKNCTFDICWHFSISMNYMLKISAGKVFRSNLRNVFQLSEKKAVNYNFHFLYICLETCTARSRKNFEVLFLLLICSEKLNKDLSLFIEPSPFNLERQHMHLLLDIFTFWSKTIA